MTDITSTLLELAGFALVILGLWLLWTPLALIAVGCVLVAAGYLAGDDE